MAYVGANRKEIVNFYLYTPLLLLILQSAGNSGYIKKPDIQLNKIRKYGKARFFSFICGLGLSYPKNLETFRSDPAISSATSYHSPLPPSPQSLPPQHTLKHTGDFATVVPSATTSLPLTSLPLPRGLLAIFQ